MRHPAPIKQLIERLRNKKAAPPEPVSSQEASPPLGRDWNIYEGADDTEAGKLAKALLQMIETGRLGDLDAILAEEVIYLVPGQGRAAGLHRGRAAVTAALTQPAATGVHVTVAEPTELLTNTDRAVIIIAVTGTLDGGPFTFETVLHLRSSSGLIIAITEYSGNQYLADLLVRPRSR